MREENAAVRATVTIAATAEQVWRVLTDLPAYRRWHPFLDVLDGPPAGELATGSVLRLRAGQGTPAEREFDVTVTEATRPSVLAWEGGDPRLFFGRHRFTLTGRDGEVRLEDEEVFTGAMVEAVLSEHRTALEASYQAAALALKDTVERGLA